MGRSNYPPGVTGSEDYVNPPPPQRRPRHGWREVVRDHYRSDFGDVKRVDDQWYGWPTSDPRDNPGDHELGPFDDEREAMKAVEVANG